MINKQERYFVVSESDLAKFAHGCALLFESQRCLTKEVKDMCVKAFQVAEAVCRAREVDWEYKEDLGKYWYEVEK